MENAVDRFGRDARTIVGDGDGARGSVDDNRDRGSGICLLTAVARVVDESFRMTSGHSGAA
jgi:hypothetical protein